MCRVPAVPVMLHILLLRLNTLKPLYLSQLIVTQKSDRYVLAC